MSAVRYGAVVVTVAAGSLALAWGLLRDRVAAEAWPAAALGAVLATANTLVAFVTATWSLRRSQQVFLGAVLGGMTLRMGLLLAAVVVAVLWAGVPRLPLAFSLLAYFVLFLVFELTVLHRLSSSPAGSR